MSSVVTLEEDSVEIYSIVIVMLLHCSDWMLLSHANSEEQNGSESTKVLAMFSLVHMILFQTFNKLV